MVGLASPRELFMISTRQVVRAVLFLVVLSGQLHAEVVVQGQFVNPSTSDTGGGYTGYQTTPGGILNSAGSTWNQIAGDFGSPSLTAANPLLSATGTSTTINFLGGLQNTSARGVNAAFKDDFMNTWNGFQSIPNLSLMNNCAYSDAPANDPNSFAFTGLSPGLYDLFIYTQGDIASDNRNLRMNVMGVEKVTVATVASAGSFIENQNYLLFSNITVTSGTLSGTWWNPGTYGGSEANWNGFQLRSVAVPEPSTYAMALLGAGIGGWRMWRSRVRSTRSA